MALGRWLVVLGLLAAACGDSPATSPTDTASSPTGPTPTTTAPTATTPGTSDIAGTSYRLSADEVEYVGAFRLPEGDANSDWTFSGYGLTYYPEGDSQAPDDGFPGSLFGI